MSVLNNDVLLLCAVARQALTDGFHFHGDILSSLYSFPLELVSRLRRPASLDHSSVLEPPGEVDDVDSEGADDVQDLPPDTECNRADDESATVDVPVEDCSITLNSASNTESVEMSECNVVLFIVIVY